MHLTLILPLFPLFPLLMHGSPHLSTSPAVCLSTAWCSVVSPFQKPLCTLIALVKDASFSAACSHSTAPADSVGQHRSPRPRSGHASIARLRLSLLPERLVWMHVARYQVAFSRGKLLSGSGCTTYEKAKGPLFWVTTQSQLISTGIPPLRYMDRDCCHT